MRSIKVYCDRCGKEISYDNYQGLYLGKSRSYELCPECYDSISDKLEAAEREINKEGK